MYVDDMLDILGLRMEDAEEQRFTGRFKWRALNNGQYFIANVLNNHYLTQLEVLDSNETVSSDKVAFSGLTYDVLRGSEGIINVKNHSGKYCTIIPSWQLKRTQNGKIAGSTRNPLVWLFDEAVRCLQTLTALDVYYLKTPSPLMHPFTFAAAGTPAANAFAIDDSQGIAETDDYYNDAPVYIITENGDIDGVPFYDIATDYTGTSREIEVSQSNAGGNYGAGTFYFVPTKDHDFHLTNLDAVTCDLDPSLHELVITFAEVECWKMARQLDRAASALESGIDIIKGLNEAYKAAEGIGTQGRKRA